MRLGRGALSAAVVYEREERFKFPFTQKLFDVLHCIFFFPPPDCADCEPG